MTKEAENTVYDHFSLLAASLADLRIGCFVADTRVLQDRFRFLGIFPVSKEGEVKDNVEEGKGMKTVGREREKIIKS